MKFEIYRTTANGLLAAIGQGGWRWRLKGANGEPIASGESYVRKEDCMHAISLVKGTTQLTPVIETTS